MKALVFFVIIVVAIRFHLHCMNEVVKLGLTGIQKISRKSLQGCLFME